MISVSKAIADLFEEDAAEGAPANSIIDNPLTSGGFQVRADCPASFLNSQGIFPATLLNLQVVRKDQPV